MDLDRLTQKSQQALSDAQDLATRSGHTEVDGEHLLLALVDQPDGLVPRLLTGLGVDLDGLRGASRSSCRTSPGRPDRPPNPARCP